MKLGADPEAVAALNAAAYVPGASAERRHPVSPLPPDGYCPPVRSCHLVGATMLAVLVAGVGCGGDDSAERLDDALTRISELESQLTPTGPSATTITPSIATTSTSTSTTSATTLAPTTTAARTSTTASSRAIARKTYLGIALPCNTQLLNLEPPQGSTDRFWFGITAEIYRDCWHQLAAADWPTEFQTKIDAVISATTAFAQELQKVADNKPPYDAAPFFASFHDAVAVFRISLGMNKGAESLF